MDRILEILANETNGKSYHTYKYSYDTIGIPAIDYDDNSERVIKWQSSGETNSPKRYVDLQSTIEQIKGQEPLIQYFLDGSRHVYKVDDMSYNKLVFPIVAGQVGVGCCKRVNRKMEQERFYRKLVISLPDKSNSGGWDDEQYFALIVNKVNECNRLKKLGLSFDEILYYSTRDMGKKEVKLEDRAIATIQDCMIETEKIMVEDLVKEGKLNQNSYLLKDGSLEYSKNVKRGREDLRNLQRIKNNYNWVIGVSKSFNPESCKDHTGKSNSNYIADLPVFCRTPVARYSNPDYLGDVSFGVWYIRLRDKKRTSTPFDGVVKVEKLMMDYELENGIDSEEIDLISANILNERNPVCYGTDRRWANHLYPVFLTETYVKSKYLSTDMFLNLF